MSRSYSAEALVINRRNSGEADKVITLLSKFRGKFDANAKGVRKIASRRGPNLDLLNHIKASFASGKNLDVITEVQTLDSFKRAKGDLEKIGYSYHITELVKEFLEEGQGGRDVFDLLLTTLKELDKAQNPRKIGRILRSFEIKLLYYAGYKPQMGHCVVCGDNSPELGNFISPQAGGVVGSKCGVAIISKRPISTDAIKILRFLQYEPMDRINKLNITQDLNSELEDHLRFYIEYILGKELKSIKFINQVRKV